MNTRLFGRAVALVGAALTFAASPALAVNVSPAVLYIDARTREAVVTLFNGGKGAEEISLGFVYGRSVADLQGRVRLVLADSAPAGAASAVTWLRAFPRRIVLQPGEKQVVRVIVQPPAGVQAGEYVARLVVTATPLTPTVEERRGDATMQLRIGSRVVVGVHYRVGRVATGATVENSRAERVGADKVDVVLDLGKAGNAAFIGRFRARLLAADGSVVGDYMEPLTLYESSRRRFTVPVKAGSAAPVAVEFTLDTDRPDLPVGTVLRAEPVTGRASITEGAATAARQP